jgi:hypothetical protein
MSRPSHPLDYSNYIIFVQSTNLEAPHYAVFPTLLSPHPSSVQISSASCSQTPSVCVPLIMSETILVMLATIRSRTFWLLLLISKLQRDIELKQTRVLIWKILLFLNIISLYIEALVPSFRKPLKTNCIKFFRPLLEPGGDFPFLLTEVKFKLQWSLKSVKSMHARKTLFDVLYTPQIIALGSG